MDTRLRTLLAAAGLWLGCHGSLFRLTVDESSEVVVPAATLLEVFLADFGFGELVTMDLTESQELENQGVAPGDIRDAELVDFVLTATAPTGADLSFLDRMEVWVEAPGLPRVRVAVQDDFPPGVAEVTFDLEDVDLTDYVVSQSMTFGTDVTGRRPEDETTVRADVSVRVGVTGQGACGGGGDGG